jgi:outer membrane immunogenic protein
MRKFRIVVLGLAAGAVAALVATGADANGRRKGWSGTPVSWTGLYFGINAGWHNLRGEISNSGTDTGPAGLGSALALGGIPASMDLDSKGFIGGLQLGYNWQSGSVVLGLEADIQWVEGRDSVSVTTDTPELVPITTTASHQLDWLSTVRARVGFLVAPELMVYGTGGLAIGDIKTTVSGFAPTGSPPLSSSGSSSTDVGWTAGGGAEFALFRDVSLKGEYLYYDLGETSSKITYNYGLFTSTMTSRSDNTGHIARAGLNFKF